MRKEQITDKEAIYVLMLFIMGSTLIVGIGGEAKNDAWIAGIAGILMAVPMILIYSRIISIFPGKDLFEIIDISFGRILGRIISLIYIWYAFHLGALVLRNFGEFISIETMPETPIIVPMLGLGLVCIVAVRLGIENIARFSAYILPVLLFIMIIVQIFALHEYNLDYLQPVLGNGFGPVIKGGFSAFSFPFAETVLFIGAAFSLKTRRSPYKVYSYALLFAGILIILITIRNTAILGILIGKLYFPSYEAVGKITIGYFIQRMEVTVAIVFVVGAFIKCSICLLTAGRGISRLFSLSDYRSIVIQLGLMMIYFSYIVYDTAMEMEYWAFKVYPYYAFPMQVILPIIIWLFAELKYRKLNTL